ncbi:hydrogenase nickel incorporation protein HypA/HybF [Methylomarinovum tepidoasis]|uniref:Hydrogenase maturation factor HypA n=1 Tax=Methylomarinovum tepidoasis TaxID=2840183 RepID=A0AAU9D3U5_9GAMM|nr:hydrogenase maturation nickel metallochaperone HypA [Methylomarinovum sp. IN45]BCX89649.1 hydrogenase nickel incorporation protein HypA/HybF [Methylomarinovum sp. IN45]
MHELSLAESLREIIETEAGRQGFSRVERVILQVGALSCVEPEAMRFCFDAVMAGSVAEGGVLEIVEVPGRGRCGGCGEAEMGALYDPCPGCGRPLEVVQGREIRLLELSVT